MQVHRPGTNIGQQWQTKYNRVSVAAKVTTRRSNRSLIKGVDQPPSSGPVDMSDEIEASDSLETAVEGSYAKSVSGSEGLDANAVYVPNWGVKVGDSFKDATVCEDVLNHFAPPMGVARFRKRMHEYEEFSKRRDKMKASIDTLKKENDGFAKKEEAWVKNLGSSPEGPRWRLMS
ncbi:hypothetical protein Hanom_Chr05g00457611 [Helianthus anomalus]